MSSIITLDALNEEAELEPTHTNFPALQHFWQCKETTLDNGLTDSVGGVVTGAFSAGNADGSKLTAFSQASANNTIASGTLESPDSKVAILFTAANLSGNGILNIGLPNGQGGTGSLQVLANVTKHQADDGTDTAGTATATFGNAVEAHATVLVPDTSLTGYRVQSDETYGVNGTPDTTNPVTIDTMNQSTAFGNNAVGNFISMYGCAVFFFDAVPSDLKPAMLWMYNEWVNNNNKVIYPAWKGKS